MSPSNMGFQEDGSLKFTSYMNNLHPTRYPEIYRVIETLATTALPLSDRCLAVNVSYKEDWARKIVQAAVV